MSTPTKTPPDYAKRIPHGWEVRMDGKRAQLGGGYDAEALEQAAQEMEDRAAEFLRRARQRRIAATEARRQRDKTTKVGDTVLLNAGEVGETTGVVRQIDSSGGRMSVKCGTGGEWARWHHVSNTAGVNA
jgi:hypothetical protein